MASSPNTQVTFATLPREVHDKIYRQMLAEPKMINAETRELAEDWSTLRPMLHACRKSPRYAEEAIEAHFEINTFRIRVDDDSGLMNRPAYYLNGRGFVPNKMHVRSVVIDLTIATTSNATCSMERRRLCQCFRDLLLACPVLRRVTVKVSLLADGEAERYEVLTNSVVDEDHLAELEIILAIATESYQVLKERIGLGLRFDSQYERIRESLEEWEERVESTTVEERLGVVDSEVEG